MGKQEKFQNFEYQYPKTNLLTRYPSLQTLPDALKAHKDWQRLQGTPALQVYMDALGKQVPQRKAAERAGLSELLERTKGIVASAFSFSIVSGDHFEPEVVMYPETESTPAVTLVSGTIAQLKDKGVLVCQLDTVAPGLPQAVNDVFEARGLYNNPEHKGVIFVDRAFNIQATSLVEAQ